MAPIANLETQIQPFFFYSEFDNLPGGSNKRWDMPDTHFTVPIGYMFVLSTVRVIFGRTAKGNLNGPFDVSVSIEQAAAAKRVFESGPTPARLFGVFVANGTFLGITSNPNYPLTSLHQFDEMGRPFPAGDSLLVRGSFLAGSANSGVKKIGVCLSGNLVPVALEAAP